MPLHDAVGVNSKKGTTAENQGARVKYLGKEVYLDDCVCVCVCVLSDLTWQPLIGGWRKSWYIIIIILYMYCEPFVDNIYEFIFCDSTYDTP